MKTIIQRNLPLNVKYTVIDRKYIPVLEGGGSVCDNCGKLIANIATVKSVNGTFNIGFDCMETFLLNNQILEGFNIEEHERIKKMIPKAIRLSKQVKDFISLNKGLNVSGLEFERSTYETDWITWYYTGNFRKYNTNIKLKDVDFDFIVDTIKNIFPKLDIIIK